MPASDELTIRITLSSSVHAQFFKQFAKVLEEFAEVNFAARCQCCGRRCGHMTFEYQDQALGGGDLGVGT